MNVEFRDVTGLSKGFHLSHVNLEIREGYLTALVGKNGAGKSTLFRYLMDPGIRYDGEILVDGDANLIKQAAFKNRIGFVDESRHFFMDKTALENSALYATLYDRFDMELFRAQMHRMEIPVHRTPGEMSRGQYLKFQMAFAMAHGSRLYLLDEVTAGMDPVFRKDFFRVLHEILKEEDVAILMSSHIEEEIARHMDYVAVMEKGTIISYQ